MKKTILLLFGCTLFAHHKSEAGGFKIGLQGIKQIGMGHTGVGFAQDAATVYFNPAGMSFVSSQINVGANALIPTTSFLETGTNSITNATTQVFTPFSAYANTKLSKRVNFGLGVYTPFGSGVTYPTSWSGRHVLTNIALQTVHVQPTLSYRLTKHLSIGGGIIFSNGNVELGKDLPIASSSITEPAHANLSGKATGTGYNLGLYYNNTKKYNFGIVYHSKVAMKVDKGTASFTNIPLALSSTFPANNTFTTSLNLPSELAIGASAKLSNAITVAADFNYTYWKSFDSLGFDYGTNTSAVSDAKSPRLYENAMAFRIGVQGQVNPNIALRAGAFYDQTPVQAGYVAPELPDNNKIGLTCGASLQIANRVQVDLSLLYENVEKRTQTNIETGLSGTFQTKAIAPGVGVTYLFQKRTIKHKNY